MVTRMLTLHNALNDYMCRIDRQHNPLCSRCREGRETPSHLFEYCVTLVAIKGSTFGSTTTTLKEVMYDRRIDELLKFVLCETLCSYSPLDYPVSANCNRQVLFSPIWLELPDH